MRSGANVDISIERNRARISRMREAEPASLAREIRSRERSRERESLAREKPNPFESPRTLENVKRLLFLHFSLAREKPSPNLSLGRNRVQINQCIKWLERKSPNNCFVPKHRSTSWGITLHWIELNWMNWMRLDRFRLKWIELNWIGLNGIELDWIGLNWIGLNWIKLDWIKFNSIGCDRIEVN